MSKKMALGPYLKKIEDLCEPLSKEELQGIILSIAREARVHERAFFISRLSSYLPRGLDTPEPVEGASAEDILADIEALKESILERIETIESGEYEELEDFEGHDIYDYDPDYVSEAQLEELGSFADDAGRYFLNGELESARQVYKAVFDLIQEADIEHYIQEIDMVETRARHSRCVYKLTSGPQRIEAFWEVMVPDIADSGGVSPPDAYPMLQDVVESMVDPLPDFEDFLLQWESALSQEKIPGKRRADLLLEAVGLRNDLNKISELARNWGDKQPKGYIFWLEQLAGKGSWKETAEVSREALSRLSPDRQRDEAAWYLVLAGKQLENDELVLEGKREVFFSSADITSLMLLIEEAEKNNLREKELAGAVEYLDTEEFKRFEQDMLAAVLLMAGRIEDAFAYSGDMTPVGWSYASPGGLLFSSILNMAGGLNEDCSVTLSIMDSYAGEISLQSSYHHFPGAMEEVEQKCSSQIKNGLAIAMPRISDSELERYFNWATEIGEKRIDHIVSNKHRKAYNRAARVLVALAETYAARGDKKKASSILKKYYHELFSRFSAFRAEVKGVLLESQILNNQNIKL